MRLRDSPGRGVSSLDGLTIRYYYEGTYVASRRTTRGVEILAVGWDEAKQYRASHPPETRQDVRLGIVSLSRLEFPGLQEVANHRRSSPANTLPRSIASATPDRTASALNDYFVRDSTAAGALLDRLEHNRTHRGGETRRRQVQQVFRDLGRFAGHNSLEKARQPSSAMCRSKSIDG